MDAGHPLNSSVLGHLDWMDDRLGPKRNARAKEMLLMYSTGLLAKLGWERKPQESTFDTLLRSSAILQSGISGDEPTIQRSNRMFDDFIKRGRPIDSNLRGAIYSLAAWTRGEEVFGILRERFLKEKVPDEKIRFLRAISMFNDSKLILKAFDFAMSDAVRLQDKFMVPAIASSNPAANGIILDWTEKHWKELLGIFASGTHMISRYVTNLAVLSTEEDRKEIRRFFTKRGNFRDDIRQDLDKTLEQIEANIRFTNANE
jgi:hypothetical protein